jgi:hypothetical protein
MEGVDLGAQDLTLGQDVNAVGRIDELLPSIPGDFKVTASQALTWMKLLTGRFGELDGTVGALADGFQCAVKNGIVQAAAYATQALTQAGVIFIVSGYELANPSIGVVRCLVGKALNGGPASPQYHPCYTNFAITSDVGKVSSNYYIFAAGTNEAWCEFMKTAYSHDDERSL